VKYQVKGLIAGHGGRVLDRCRAESGRRSAAPQYPFAKASSFRGWSPWRPGWLLAVGWPW